MPLLSVIIPVYNVAPYLDECIASVVGQNYTDIEIICVNDGSTDGSDELLDQWAERDGRIIVIHQNNQGVSSARNNGLKKAKGVYVTFVDADDVVRPHIYSWSLKAIEINRLDAFIFAFETYPSLQIETTGFPNGIVLNYHQLFASNPSIQSRNSLCFSWRFVFRTEIIKTNQLFYDPDISIGEDMIYNVDVICHCHRIMVTDKPLYLYRKNNPNSAMTIPFKPTLEQSLSKMFDYKLEQLSRYGLMQYKNYPKDIAKYTIMVYLRLLIENAYANPMVNDMRSEIRRILSLPFIRKSFDYIGFRNIHSSINEYIFYLALKFKIMPVVERVYNRSFAS